MKNFIYNVLFVMLAIMVGSVLVALPIWMTLIIIIAAIILTFTRD